MSPLLAIIYALPVVIIAVAVLVILNSIRSKGAIARSLDMVLFVFHMPRFQASSQQADNNKLISIMEQLYAAVATMRVKGWNKFLFGDPYIVLEIANDIASDRIQFYIAVPSRYANLFEKQAHGTFPEAQIERARDYTIFGHQNHTAGGYLTLTSDNILPFQTYSQLAVDPLGPIVSAFSKLNESGEGAALQVIMRPSDNVGFRKLAMDTARQMQAGNDFFKALKLAKNPPAKDDKKPEGLAEPPKIATEFESAIIKALQGKASRPLFDCNIRLLASAADEFRAGQILDELASAFAQYGGAEMNSFKLKKQSGRELEKLAFDYSFRLFDDRQKIYLSGEEIASVYHLPVGTTALPKVIFANFRTAEPPAGIPTEGIAFGYNDFHGRRTFLRLGKEDRRRHMYVIGQTGTGKSVTASAMIFQDLAAGEGLTVMDPHGELAERTLERIPKSRLDDVIYFDPADVDNPMGLNMLEHDPANPQEKTLIIDELFEIMAKLYDLSTSGGPQFERYFKNALFLLMDNYERRVPVLADLSRVFVDEAFRNDLLAHETNQIVKQFWEKEATKATGDQSLANFAGYVTSKVDTFTSNDFLRPIINQTRSVIDFKEVIENKKILVVNLSKGKIGDLNANLLGMVIIGKLRRAAMARDTKRDDLPDHYVYMDEFQNFTTNSISTILAEARKYRLCLVMLHQFIKQLDDKIRDAVFGNVGTMICFRISPEDAESSLIKTKFEPVFTPYDISNIDNHNAYVSMLVNGQVGRPTNMVDLLQDIIKGDMGIIALPADKKIADAIVQLSRLKYGRPRAEIEAEIQARFATKSSTRSV